MGLFIVTTKWRHSRTGRGILSVYRYVVIADSLDEAMKIVKQRHIPTDYSMESIQAIELKSKDRVMFFLPPSLP